MLVYTPRTHWPDASEAFGATTGQDHIAPLVTQLHGIAPGETVIYDFAGIEHTTASYIRATVLRLLHASFRATGESAVSGSLSVGSGETWDIFPLVANLSSDVAEEIQTVMESQNIACLEATKWTGTGVIQARVRGVLEGALRDTLLRVVAARKATATMLAEREPPHATGWNNRLAEVYRMRLLRRVKEGRQWVYSPVCSEVIFG